MIEHAHGEHRVEAFQLFRQFLQRQRQVPGRQVGQVVLHGEELAEEQPVGIDADHAVGAGAEHAPLVVAVAAADIQHALAGKIQMRGDPCPLPVRVPLGIDMHAEQLERPLAPGDQALERLLQGGALLAAAGAGQGEAFGQLAVLDGQRRQGVDGGLPAGQVAVAAGQLVGEQLGQGGRPGGQRRAAQTVEQGGEVGAGGEVGHGRAISEAKLRHWNQGMTFEKPAASRRSRCSSRLSGFITFSMALRFWAISSSL
ncbi:hypothetical protein D3C78_1052140 [compost metagenome]